MSHISRAFLHSASTLIVCMIILTLWYTAYSMSIYAPVNLGFATICAIVACAVNIVQGVSGAFQQ